MVNPSKKLGVVVGVDGSISQVGMYSMSNDPQLLWYGDILTGPKNGAFLTINQNDIKIITTVSSEKIIDQQNTIKSVEFDNRFNKNSINRVVFLKTKGVIEDEKFTVTSQYVPMVGNEVTLTTIEELNFIFGINPGEDSIYIGKSLLENQDINIPINKFFASHIGIFGNTGSGKSNTLHKLYLELFRSEYRNDILEYSQFFVIDFNGEYTGIESFEIHKDKKLVFEIDTRSENSGQKLPIKKSYLFDPDILAILFDAKPATQVPFLRNALRTFNNKIKNENDFSEIELGLLTSIIGGTGNVGADALENWIKAAESVGLRDSTLEGLKELSSIKIYGNLNIYSSDGLTIIFQKGRITESGRMFLKLSEIEEQLSEKYKEASPIYKLYYFLEFQKVYVSAWKSTNIEFINPLFHRMQSAFESLEKVVEIKDDLSGCFKPMNIISLIHANLEISRLMPMLLSKMIYDEQKKNVAGKEVNKTKHLIIDEAHNILNSDYRDNGDGWQDYRLSVFEEIIKEGRKFGFYLTLSSQRPADISSTIMSQLHNYLIHRLVNEKDLRMLENTMPTLDGNSYDRIPSLGQGEAIITGNAMQVPIFVKVEKEEINRPKSDDVILTNLWSNHSIEE
ncbi:ATP-binding protein [Erysipelothrix rhusiopathiae]|nr:ATP-binding protein [Erysipelothrix rhusiopathiae]MDE8042722.1 ATP-binding protein [Erysipelothrix rhusiopathiae]MDE8050596.1 ATP-binding protein [Erysipelothrix rhusiopathiae]MDE8058940.1 ATP-binding protein [Erysipelothrix rhusiopathiae]MDE8067547.1 ATP-binding protein [Erysipelothrix rhusiopathiae]